ncbi:DMT family transporter [Noviherbaspirillum sp. CPCC 100848]|uniref:DMT family transporter n=1 Tax=Noviherbaspirillum album TaxID=3080276 RepID=A0ABU6JFY3_9BURK|nr:DMT family transporter [Noviherbaspirillum sp. CPCC 100848]MEC4722581.1 DMT family transporter [Noviherbaspirillum sp. CPCC 100848]
MKKQAAPAARVFTSTASASTPPMPIAGREAASIPLIAFAALVLGAAALACGGVFIRHSELPPTASAVYRVGLAAPLLFFLNMFAARKAQQGFPAPQVGIMRGHRRLLAVGFIFSGNLALYHWAMSLTTLANSNLLANLAPIFVVIGGRIFFKQRFSKGFLAGMSMALVGAFVLISARFDLRSAFFHGNLLGVASGMFYGAYLLAVSRMRAEFDTTAVMAWSSLGSFLVLLPAALLMGEQLMPQTLHGWLVLLALALVSHVAGQGMIAYALAKLPAGLSSVTLLIQPVIAAALGWFLLHERLDAAEIVGGLIVLAGIGVARRFS